MAKYRKKPVVIEAVQLKWETWSEVCDFVAMPYFGGGVFVSNESSEFSAVSKTGFDRIGLVIHTLEGDHLAIQDDYIIKGVHGEFYPCKPDIFGQTYEPAEGV